MIKSCRGCVHYHRERGTSYCRAFGRQRFRSVWDGRMIPLTRLTIEEMRHPSDGACGLGAKLYQPRMRDRFFSFLATYLKEKSYGKIIA